MLQFADISRPGVAHKFSFGFTGQPPYLFLVFPVISVQEMFGQQEYILSAFTQRRNMQFDGIDAVKQILPELSFLYQFSQICIGGTDQPDIDIYGTDCAQTGDAPLLDSCQKLGLHGQWQVSDLIQEKCSSRSHFHSSGLGLAGIRESTFLITEELTLKQLFGYTSQVNGDEGIS